MVRNKARAKCTNLSLIVIAFFIFQFIFIAPNVSAATYYVRSDGTGNFATSEGIGCNEQSNAMNEQSFNSAYISKEPKRCRRNRYQSILFLYNRECKENRDHQKGKEPDIPFRVWRIDGLREHWRRIGSGRVSNAGVSEDDFHGLLYIQVKWHHKSVGFPSFEI